MRGVGAAQHAARAPAALSPRLPPRALRTRRAVKHVPGRRQTVSVTARYEALLEPSLDETLRRALSSLGSTGGGGGGPADAAAAAARHALSLPGAHHVAAHASGPQAGLYLSTFCALSVALGALIYNFGGVVGELMRLQRQSEAPPSAPSLLYGVEVARSTLLRDDAVLTAARFAAAAHEGQVRKTGEPYVAHCVEAALIVERNLPKREAEAERHRAAVMAALLHDVLDDTAVGYAQLEEAFGPRVAGMVAQVSKLSAVNQMLRRDKRRGVISSDPAYWQSTWRRLKRMMVEAVMSEPLVILVKLADRLHNMRTLYSLPRDKQAAVAEETLHVWCSMAGYLGWHTLKAEMEDLCFAVLEEGAYCDLRQQLDALWAAPPAPRRRRARDSGRRRQLARAAERHERQREERAERRAAAAAAAGAAGWPRPLAGLIGWAGGGSSDSAGRHATVDSSMRHVGSSAVAVAEAPPSTAAASSKHATGGGGASATVLEKEQDRGSSVSGSGGSSSWPPSWAVSLGGRVSVGGGDGAPTATDPSATVDGWPSDRGPLVPAPLGWEAEGWEPASAVAPALARFMPPSWGAAAAAAGPSAASLASNGPSLTPQQEQLRTILSTVVPFDAVSFKSASDLSWSAQRGLALLDAAAGQLYTELSVGSFGGGLDVVIQGRLKSLYSVHRKMQRKGCSLEEVYDARALRVIVDDCGGARLGDAIQTCYRLVAAVHKLWRPIAREFDDYISNPKASGYQALHTAVWGPGGAALEVQIKTRRMHEDAEYGGAAHWAYKEGGPLGAAGTAGPGPNGSWAPSPSPDSSLDAGDGYGSEAAAAAAVATAVAEPAAAAPAAVATASSSEAGLGQEQQEQQPQQQLAVAVQKPPQAPVAPPCLAGPYPGQPILRVSHCLRYGAVLSVGPPASTAAAAAGAAAAASSGPAAPRLAQAGSSTDGSGVSASAPTQLFAVIQNGGTSEEHPLRRPDYGFYAGLAAYAREHGWSRPGQGDLRARVEEFVLCRDGRWHRRDHLGYTHPDTTATLLEGYGAEAAAAAAAVAAAGDNTAAAPVLVGAATAAAASAPDAAASPAAATAAAAVPAETTATAPAPVRVISESQGGAAAAYAAAAAAAEEQARWQAQWAATAAKAAQLRAVIEWGQELAEGMEAPTRSDEVSVLCWPGGTIEDVPRGTTAGELFRRKGVFVIEGEGDGSASDGGSAAAASGAPAAAAGRGRGARRFNVNNRLVDGDTPLEDGDLVILAHHTLRDL